MLSHQNASEQEKKIAEEVREWIEDIQDFEMFCLMRWMLLGMVTAVKKLNGIKLATYGCRKL